MNGVAVALPSIGTALKIAKNIKDLAKSPATANQAHERLIELNEQLLTIKEKNLELRQMLLLVQEDHLKREAFDVDVTNSVLAEISPNSLAYVLMSPLTDAEKSQCHCVNCFGRKRKSVFHFCERGSYLDKLICPECHATILKPNGERQLLRETLRSDTPSINSDIPL